MLWRVHWNLPSLCEMLATQAFGVFHAVTAVTLGAWLSPRLPWVNVTPSPGRVAPGSPVSHGRGRAWLFQEAAKRVITAWGMGGDGWRGALGGRSGLGEGEVNRYLDPRASQEP